MTDDAKTPENLDLRKNENERDDTWGDAISRGIAKGLALLPAPDGENAD